MFENLKSKTGIGGAEQSGSINIIGQGTTIEGQINANGDLRIDGVILGSVTSKAKVVIGSTGQVQGDVEQFSYGVEFLVFAPLED